MADDTNTADTNKPQRPVGIRPISVTPIKPAGAEQQPNTPLSGTSPTIRLKPPVITSGGDGAKVVPPLKPAGIPNSSPAAETPAMPQVAKPDNKAASSESPTVRIKPLKPTVVPPAPSKPIDQSAEKGKTSRISLDSALSGADSSPGPSGMSFNTKPVNAPLGKITSHIPDDVSEKIKSSTVKLSIPNSELEDAQQMTRKRTLRMKVPAKNTADSDGGAASEAKTIKRIAIKKNDSMPPDADEQKKPGMSVFEAIPGTEDGNVSAFAPMPVLPREKVSVFFPICAAATIIVSILTLVLFSSQAFGPDRSLTPFSSNTNFPEIGWPGKIAP